MAGRQKRLIGTQTNTDKLYILTGIFFLILQVLVIIYNFNKSRYSVFYWFCNHTPLILGIAFLFKKNNIIKAIINVGLISQLLWTLDFWSRALTGHYLLNVTEYVFTSNHPLGIIVPLLVHTVSITLALLVTYKEKPTPKVLLYSTIYLILLYFTTLIFTNPAENINCVQQICGVTQFTFIGYTILWIPITFILIVLPSYGIQYAFYKISKRLNKK